MPVKTLNAISLKILDKQVKNLFYYAFKETYLEIFLKWNKKTIIIAESIDANKISLYISTFDMRLPNIIQIMMFTEFVHKKLLIAL